MRMESGALIAANVKLRQQLEIAEKALRFYKEGQHFDTVRVDGDPEGIKRTRILDTGGMAEEALAEMESPSAYVPQRSDVLDWVKPKPHEKCRACGRQVELESSISSQRPPKPKECEGGCPPKQVCDHCQWPVGNDIHSERS